jgi:crossover junction endodeoxyribonuclease RusA
MLNRTINIPGRPRPQGSKRHVGHGIMVEASPHTRTYRADIQTEWDKFPVLVSELPVTIWVTFTFARPASHYLPANRKRVERELRADAPTVMDGPPDIDKLLRAVLDSLTGRAYRDDRQVVQVMALKQWGEYDVTSLTVQAGER